MRGKDMRLLRKTLLVVSLFLLLVTAIEWGRSHLVRPSTKRPNVNAPNWYVQRVGTDNRTYVGISADSGLLGAVIVRANNPCLLRVNDVGYEWGGGYVPRPSTGGYSTTTPRVISQGRAFLWNRTRQPNYVRLSMCLPFWVPAVSLTIVAACLGLMPIIRKQFRMRHNLCMRCGYSLTGNESGVCPECGARVEKPPVQRDPS